MIYIAKRSKDRLKRSTRDIYRQSTHKLSRVKKLKIVTKIKEEQSTQNNIWYCRDQAINKQQ